MRFNGLRIALFAALVGAAVQSMVDGVIVMPTTMVWLAIIMGWTWALQPTSPSGGLAVKASDSTATGPSAFIKHSLLCLPFVLSALWLSAVAIRDIPMLIASSDAHAPEQRVLYDLKPRFWLRGFII